MRPPPLSELMPVTPVRSPPLRIYKRERVRDGSTMDLREREEEEEGIPLLPGAEARRSSVAANSVAVETSS